jgi:tRNA G18 (ribose-2'-O)-methylase SpoU
MRGYFGIGIFQGKTVENLGTLWRTADLFGASFIFTIGRRYKHQPTDTFKTTKHIPLYHYETFEQFKLNRPIDCLLIGVELHETSQPIRTFSHPERAIYLLGAEDNGLSKECIKECNRIIQLPGERSMNVAVAGSIVMFDRINKLK